jgi:site-specific DNA recombinase
MNRAGPSNRLLRVALYARVSTDRQAKDGTIDSQVSALRACIEGAREVLDDELIFCDDGVSGATLARPALDRLRDQAAAGLIDRLYVLAPDRLARRHAHQYVLMEELQAGGVEVVFANRPVGVSAEDQLLVQVQGVVAEYERAKILERTRRGRLHAARSGRVSVLGRAAYGYRYIDVHAGGGRASYEVDDDEARIVVQIFDWVGREGCSLSEVVRRLERLKIPTKRGLPRWERSTIWGLLTNPAYQGKAAYGKTRRAERRARLRPMRGQPEVSKRSYSTRRQPVSEQIAIPVPALVDAEVYAAVQERMEHNRERLRQRKRGARNLLQGLVVCGCCGHAIVGRGKVAAGSRAYYGCLGADRYRYGGQAVCDNRRQRVEDLDAAVWTDVCELLNDPARLRQEYERRWRRPVAETGTAEVERLQKTIAKVRQGLCRLLDAYADGLTDRAEFQPRTERLRERLKVLESEQKVLTDRAQRDEDLGMVFSRLEEFADQMKAGLETADWTMRREILRALVKRVEVGKETIDIVYKVPACPFAKAPDGGPVQHCCPRQAATSVARRGCGEMRAARVGAPGNIAAPGAMP